MNWDSIILEIKAAVRECGQVLLQAYRSADMTLQKEGHANFVTTYDRRIQEMLKIRLARILPEAHFVGEEEDLHVQLGEGYAFIVDPIDGTTNFIKDYRCSTISVGIAKAGKPWAGVIYHPYLDEMFSAVKGQGAYCNEIPIRVSDHRLKDGLVLFGTSPYYEDLRKRSFTIAYEYSCRAMDLRRSGSAAWDLCCIAAGRAELFFELILQPWDYAAGSIILQEAGGRITTFERRELPLDHGSSVLAVNQAIALAGDDILI